MLLTPQSPHLLLTEATATIAFDGIDMLLNSHHRSSLHLLHRRLYNLAAHPPEDGNLRSFHLHDHDHLHLRAGLLLYQASPEIEPEFKRQAALLAATCP